MLISELKGQIENKTLTHDMIIFHISENNWLARQYAKEMSRIFDCPLAAIDPVMVTESGKEVQYVPEFKRDIFGFSESSKELKILEIDKVRRLTKATDDLIIITKDIDKDVANTFEKYIVDVPKLVDWQVEDYALGMLDGMVEDNVKLLCKTCNYDVNRIEQEIKKLIVFEPKQRDIIFNQLFMEGGYGVAFDHNMIFTFCDAIMKRDVNTVRNIYNMITYQDIEPLGMVTILIKKFRQLADLQLNPTPTAQSCGMSDKQFWYLRKNATGIYSNQQVIRNLKLLTELDKKLKEGTLGFNASQTLTDHQFIDYMITHIMCR